MFRTTHEQETVILNPNYFHHINKTNHPKKSIRIVNKIQKRRTLPDRNQW